MASQIPQLVLVGGGNMGSALLGGLISSGWNPDDITVVEINAEKRQHLEETFGVRTTDAIVSGQGALVAVKPADVASVVAELAQGGTPRIVSIAAGVSLARLQEASSESTAVIRAMPNTPALVREGITALCAGTRCREEDVLWAEELLSSVGQVVRLPEDQMDIFTAVAGSGPAYVFLLAELLLETARDAGLDADSADRIVRQLFRGAGQLLSESVDSPTQLREKVTSPKGTTAAGLQEFTNAGLREIVKKVVAAAAHRSAEMGRELG